MRWEILGCGIFVLSLCLTAAPNLFAEPRGSHVAGSFYPANPEELRSMVGKFIEAAPVSDVSAKPRILIAPHAGYIYSGSVAGYAFRQIEGYSYDGVVVVGFTHRMHFSGASVDNREAYETPLGRIPLDLKAVQFLRDEDASVRYLEEAHAAKEHSLEVMLPFLQVALGDFKLVPILMGGTSFEDASSLADALAALSKRGDYLFVFSTDLSHYHPYDEAKRIDNGTVNAVLFETPQAVHRLFDGGAIEACGHGPIVTSLLLAARLGYPERKLLHYANSGDTTGDRSRVVGYAAIGMFDRDMPLVGGLSEEAGMELVHAARAALENKLIRGEEPEPISVDKYPELARTNGVFVTLRRNGLLCGCIGRIETNDPLAKSVPSVALDAALRDMRFAPLEGNDLDKIHVEVSVLTPLKSLGRLEDLVPGRDGVVLEADGRRGVFLPSVWTSTGWSRVEFLRELARQKAGLEPDAWRRARLYVFQAQLFEEPESD